MSSRDVAFHNNFRDCKILLKIRDLSEFPKRIRFRYVSLSDGSLMEGFTVTQIIGKPIFERAFEKPEVQEHQTKWEGNSSSESGWVDRGSPNEVVDQDLSVRCSPRSPEKAKSSAKGKGNLDLSPSYSKVAGFSIECPRSNRINLGGQLPQPLSTELELIEVTWDGQQMTMESNLWCRFLQAQGVGGSTVPLVAPTGLAADATISSSGSPIGSTKAKSSSISPGFEHIAEGRKRREVGKAKVMRKSMAHKAYQRHLPASKSLASSSKRSKSSSSASVTLPINYKIDSMLASILSNCGAKDPIPQEGLARLRALELDRAEVHS